MVSSNLNFINVILVIVEKKLVVARGQGWWGLAGEGRCDFKGVVGGRKSFVTGGYMNLHMWQIGVEL